MITQDQYNTAKQKNRMLDVKINILNYKYQSVGILIGETTEYSFSINATNDIRRNCSIVINPKDASFDIKEGNKIWMDKYVQIYIGILNERTNEIAYTNMGIYLINNPSRVYSATQNSITLECLDLMAKLTGLRNGNLEGMVHIIKSGENVRQAIIETIKLGGFNKYIVEECPITVPNDINIPIGGTLYSILTQLRDILPQYQMYFDVDGVFHYDLIPSGQNEQAMVTDDIWSINLLNYTINTSYDSVKNVIEVIGKTHDIKNFANATIQDNIYNLDIKKITSYRNNLKVGFVAPNKIINPTININGLGVKQIKDAYGKVPILSDELNIYYVVKYQSEGDYFFYMGEVTPQATIKETNPESPFYVNGTLGEIRIVLSGGEYDNIYTTDLVQQRAGYELYLNCRMQDNITLNCIPIYWLDVNWVIEITLPNKQGEEITNKYITKQISTSGGVNGTQSITAMKYYPFYPTL